MTMVPTNQIVELKARGRRDMHGVGFATFRQHFRRDVGENKRLHGLADRLGCIRSMFFSISSAAPGEAFLISARTMSEITHCP